MYIAVAGNIGSGKTTLTQMLSKHYGWKKFLEPVEKNPYLDDYYKDIPRWVLNMEIFYLKQRFKICWKYNKVARLSFKTAVSSRACMSLWLTIENGLYGRA